MKVDPANLEWRDAHELMVGCIVPRPIALISTVGADGVFNLAPFSSLTIMCMKPAILGFHASEKGGRQKKDTVVNVEFTRDFVVNIVNEALVDAANRASDSYPSNVDEFKEVGLAPVPSDLVKSPRVGESPINLECRLMQILQFGDASRQSSFIIGEVVRIHIKDELYVNDEIQMPELKAVARMGGKFYCRTRDLFEIERPEPLR